jgi:hypothetical protein
MAFQQIIVKDYWGKIVSVIKQPGWEGKFDLEKIIRRLMQYSENKELRANTRIVAINVPMKLGVFPSKASERP